MRNSRGTKVSFCPLVEEEVKHEWEAYSVEHQGWVQESLDFRGMMETASPITDHIYRMEGSHLVPDDGLRYAVTWQTSPAQANASYVNHNQLSSSFLDTFYGMSKAKEAIWSDLVQLPSDAEATYEVDSVSANGPQSYIVQPIWRDIGDNHTAADDLAGYLTLLLPWDRYFRNLLPPGVDGIDVVIENTCGEQFTFQLHGPSVHYLGEADMHDRSHDDHEIHAEFNVHDDLKISKDSVDTIDDNYCLYSIRVYPSQMFIDSHKTNKPMVYTLIVIGIFALTSAVFVMYDNFVERRQEKVMDTATRASGIVSSLFPATVRERLMQQQQLKDKGDSETQESVTSTSGEQKSPNSSVLIRMTSSLNKQPRPNSTEANNNSAEWMNTPPIADLFPSATVLFADIAGFTSWSSNREPTSVFMLLEHIYHSFDEIAKRMGDVFKVETIGDCYVATTGLPEPSENHTERMAIFAYRSRLAMNQVKQTLAETLGNDTMALSMRFGIHSGPVTAGVLRGEKSRFQLFGDTVNTTARVESLGEGDKVHISEQSAGLLIKAGKSEWVIARDQLVRAKGKGRLQTYWLVLEAVREDIG
jgi:class 3 adenylate cyclase